MTNMTRFPTESVVNVNSIVKVTYDKTLNMNKELNIVKILMYLRVPLYKSGSTYGYSCIGKISTSSVK